MDAIQCHPMDAIVSWQYLLGGASSPCSRSLNRGTTTGAGSSTSRTGTGSDDARRGGRPNSVRSSESISSLRSPARCFEKDTGIYVVSRDDIDNDDFPAML